MYRSILSFSVFLFIHYAPLLAQNNPLPSWNEGPAKQGILEFVGQISDPESPHYISPSDRIATFDQDGTLWVEHPIYTQAIFALDRIKILAPSHPEWNHEEPFKSILEGNQQAIAKFNEEDWQLIVAATHAGMSTEDFLDIVKQWLMTAKHPRFKQLYTKLVYQPMREAIDYLRANSFKVFIVTGGGQEFVRAYSQSIYGTEPEQVIGTSVTTHYEYQNGRPVLMRLPKVFFTDNYAGKAIGINLFIGKRPCAAFGNSDGDKEMLEWTQGGNGLRLMMLVHHDDPEREYAYGPAGGLPDTHVGKFSDLLLFDAKKRGWIVISMKRDWKRIFAFENAAEEPKIFQPSSRANKKL